jgi:signal transduction histidine kinase
VSIPEIISHDYGNIQMGMGLAVSGLRRRGTSPERVDRIDFGQDHVDALVRSIQILSSYPRLQVISDTMDKERLEKTYRVMEYLLGNPSSRENHRPDNIEVYIEEDIVFESYQPLIYTTTYNLARNSIRAAEGGSIEFRVETHKGVPSAIYTGRSTSQEFVAISVRDNGPGFPVDRPLKDFLDLDVTTKPFGGFGLHYVKLVCKFLGAHLNIETGPENTTVTVYHPKGLDL